MSVITLVARRLLVAVIAASVLAGPMAVAANPLSFLGLAKKSTSQKTSRTTNSGGTQTFRGAGSGMGYDGARSATAPTVAGPGYNGARSATGVTVAGNGYRGARSATGPTVAGKAYDGARSATSPSGSRTSGYTPTKPRFWR